MRNYIRSHKILTGIILVPLLLAGWPLSAPIRGELAARFDLVRGHYELLGYGLPPTWIRDYRHILQQRYGIEYRAVAGCVVSPWEVSYVDAYDSVITAAAKQRFGHDIFEEAANEAKDSWDRAMIKPSTE